MPVSKAGFQEADLSKVQGGTSMPAGQIPGGLFVLIPLFHLKDLDFSFFFFYSFLDFSLISSLPS